MWFASLVDGITLFDAGRIRTYRGDSGLKTPQIFMIWNDPELGIITGTYSGDYFHIVDDALVPLDRKDLPNDLIPLSALRDRDHNLWISTNGGGGIWRIRPSAKRLDLPSQELPHVFGMTEDREGGLWVASTMGLHQYRASPFVPWGSSEGVSEGTFVVASAGSDGVWVGSEGKGLYRLHQDGRIRNFTRETGLPSDSVSSLLVDAQGKLWVGTFGGGLVLFDRDRIERVITTEDGLPGNQVASLAQDAQGAIWIGTAAGLSRWDGQAITHAFTKENGLLADLVRDIKFDQNGDLLLSSDAGLVRFSVQQFKVTDTFTRASGLADDVVATTYVDERGVIWIGGRNGGLTRLEGDQMFRFTREHKLRVPSIMSIIEDQSGYLWLAGRRGIARARRSDLDAVAQGNASQVSMREFSERDGLRSSRVSGGYQSPGALTPDGRIWYATSRGIAVVDPAAIRPLGPNPTALIQGVLADGKVISGSPPYRIPAGTRSVQIHYAVPSLNAADRLKFRYRMAADGLFYVTAPAQKLFRSRRCQRRSAVFR